MPPYAQVSNVATSITNPVQFARAVGSTCQVLIPHAGETWTLVALPSGQLRLVSSLSYVTIGAAHPASLKFFSYISAGQSRRLGRRPLVRGTVRNPNDHPHGENTYCCIIIHTKFYGKYIFKFIFHFHNLKNSLPNTRVWCQSIIEFFFT